MFVIQGSDNDLKRKGVAETVKEGLDAVKAAENNKVSECGCSGRHATTTTTPAGAGCSKHRKAIRHFACERYEELVLVALTW